MQIRKRARHGAILLALLGTTMGVSGGIASASTTKAVSPKHVSAATPTRGGTLTVTTSIASWETFDPTSSQSEADLSDMVYGQLFTAGARGTIVPDIATGYSFANKDKAVTITLRKGVNFSDGTPLNAAAVVWNWQRDLNPATACACLKNLSFMTGVTATGPLTVRATFNSAYAPFMELMTGTAINYIVSPTAFQKEGAAAFGQAPVGAGPYLLQSSVPDVSANLVRNPHYFVKGEPYLAGITYKFVGTDAAQYSALQDHDSDVAEYVSTPSILAAAKQKSSGLQLVNNGAGGVHWMYFDTFAGPLANQTAREAVEYATNAAPINNAIFQGTAPKVESLSTKSDLYYTPTVPNYRSYDPAKAKQLVKQLGGTLNLRVLTGNIEISQLYTQALINEWRAVGINATLKVETGGVTELEQDVNSHNYDVVVATATTASPDPSVSYFFYIQCGGVLDFVCDPTINQDLALAHGLVSPSNRAAVMARMYSYMNQKAYFETFTADQSWLVASQKVQNLDPQGVGLANWAGTWLK